MRREAEQANQKWSKNKEKEKMLQSQIDSLMEEIHKKRARGKLDLQETYTQILEHLRISLVQVQQNLWAQERQIEEQKERLQLAIQERKVIEKIKEKHYAGWHSRDSQSEGALLDEISLKKPVER